MVGFLVAGWSETKKPTKFRTWLVGWFLGCCQATEKPRNQPPQGAAGRPGRNLVGCLLGCCQAAKKPKSQPSSELGWLVSWFVAVREGAGEPNWLASLLLSGNRETKKPTNQVLNLVGWFLGWSLRRVAAGGPGQNLVDWFLGWSLAAGFCLGGRRLGRQPSLVASKVGLRGRLGLSPTKKQANQVSK